MKWTNEEARLTDLACFDVSRRTRGLTRAQTLGWCEVRDANDGRVIVKRGGFTVGWCGENADRRVPEQCPPCQRRAFVQ